MSDTDVQTVMNLASCSEELAKQSLLETNSIVDAVCKIMEIPPVSQRKLTPEQEFFKKMRVDMEAMDKDITKKISQRDEPCRNQVSLQDETSIVSENTLKNQIEVPVLEEQKQGIAYPSPSECSCDSQSNVRTSPCSHLVCPPQNPSLG